MFVVLDTNHLSELVRNSAVAAKPKETIIVRDADVFISIVTAQESFEGWLALINRHKAGREQMKGYDLLLQTIVILSKYTVLPFDSEPAEIFHGMLDSGLRIGTMDLKIASICMAHDATLLTRNVVDFEKVPGLKIENWLD